MKWHKPILPFIKRLWKDEHGHGLIEYGLILALITTVTIATITSIASNLY